MRFVLSNTSPQYRQNSVKFSFSSPKQLAQTYEREASSITEIGTPGPKGSCAITVSTNSSPIQLHKLSHNLPNPSTVVAPFQKPNILLLGSSLITEIYGEKVFNQLLIDIDVRGVGCPLAGPHTGSRSAELARFDHIRLFHTDWEGLTSPFQWFAMGVRKSCRALSGVHKSGLTVPPGTAAAQLVGAAADPHGKAPLRRRLGRPFPIIWMVT